MGSQSRFSAAVAMARRTRPVDGFRGRTKFAFTSIRCTGTVVHGGRTVATAEGRIVDAAGKLYAHGTSTLLIVGS